MRTLDLVGPKGYSHGWVFHGIPGETPHTDLLRMRSEARAAHPAGHPERLKAENAVRKSRKLGMHTGTPEPPKMATTPGESPTGLGTPTPPKPPTPTVKRPTEPRVPRAKRSAKGGIHPSEITAGEPTKHTSYNYPNAKMMRQGVRPTQYEEWKTSLRHGDKHIGVVGTHTQNKTSQLYLGNKERYISGGDPQYTALTAHVQAVEKAKGMAAAEANARRARAVLSGAGYGAVKSHGTSVRGWRNYDPGHEVSAGDGGVRIEHFTGSSLGQRGTSAQDSIHRNLEGYATKLEEKGFVVDRHTENGKTAALFLPNDKQGAAPPSAPQVTHRGVTVNAADPSVQTFLHDPGRREAFKKKIEKVLDVQAKHAPHVVANTKVVVAAPKLAVSKDLLKQHPGAYTAGLHAPGGTITIHPKLATVVGKGNEEMIAFHVPTHPQIGRFQSTMTHEIGHGVHRHLPQGGYSPELWNIIADAIGAPRPELSQTKVADMRALYPNATGSIKDMLDGLTQEKVDRADALMNRSALLKWIASNTKAVRKNVSGYATQSPAELMAELWTEATANPNPRAAARAYAEYAKRKMMSQEYDLGGVGKK